MTFKRFLRAVVPGVVAFVTGEVLDPVRAAERGRRDLASARAEVGQPESVAAQSSFSVTANQSP